MTRQKALQGFVETVKKNYADKIEEIILFGSYARGDERDDSNIDVLVVLETLPAKTMDGTINEFGERFDIKSVEREWDMGITA